MIDHSVNDRALLGTLTAEQRNAIARLICPYCNSGLLETFHGGGDREGYWQHSIPYTPHTWTCVANHFRTTVTRAQIAREDSA